MSSISWYINRFKTMSVPEFSFRAIQFAQKKLEKKGMFAINHANQNYPFIFQDSFKKPIAKIPDTFTAQFSDYQIFQFFGMSVDLTKPIDWHFDISSGKRFPLSFSKDIDIRSGNYGSAKVVWEINRLQFLLPLAIKYQASKDPIILKQFISLIQDWTIQNPYIKGVNWYSNIEVNIRLIVWYYCWQILAADKELQNNSDFQQFATNTWLPSIYEHCYYSYRNPSFYSSANNHLISEYAGLFVAANCWKFSDAPKWIKYAKAGLEKEMVVQHTTNGINREEAAEYIQFITDFFLIPYAVGLKHQEVFSEKYEQALGKIITWIADLMDVSGGYRKYGDEDDGKVLVVSTNPHFNNFNSILSSGAIILNNSSFKTNNTFDLKNWLLFEEKGSNTFEQLSTSNQIKQSILHPADGHFIFRKNSETDPNQEIYMHFDAAPLGFLSIAAHGHADALSLALHIDGQPFLADIGTFTYHTDKDWRDYFISTRAHNTVCIDGKNMALQAGPTMWLEHFKTTIIQSESNESIDLVVAKHDGYDKIGCSHTRSITFYKQLNQFQIVDTIDTDGLAHEIIIPWHLHPKVSVQQMGKGQFLLSVPGNSRVVQINIDQALETKEFKGEMDPINGWFSDSFLQKEPTQVLYCTKQTNQNKQYSFTTIIEINNL